MLRLLFGFILLGHGLIHLMGFVKGHQLGTVAALQGEISKGMGTLWGLATLLFVVGFVGFFMKIGVWWVPAGLGAILSQFLILSSWSDAKFGTVANVIVLLGVVVGFGSWRFNRMCEAEFALLTKDSGAKQAVVEEPDLANLPAPVQKWLRRSGVVGSPVAQIGYIQQTGELKTGPTGTWMKFNAVQTDTISPPGFVWKAIIHSLPPIVGRDKYMNGKGEMLIQIASVIPMVHATGKDIDSGALHRFLSEVCWMPSAALATNIQWEGVSENSARATLSDRGNEVSGVFTFTPGGDFLRFEAKRYFSRPTGATLEDWMVEAKGWQVMNKTRIPTDCDVTWKLKEGDFMWLKLKILDVRS